MSNNRDELMLDSMGPSAKGGIEIKTHAGGPETSAALLLMADAMMVTLADNNAENYVEMELRASDKKQYVMTLQRKGHITPHQARVQAEQELEASKPRTVTTAAELDMLPAGSVVLSEGYFEDWPTAFQRWGDGLWYRGGRSRDTHPDYFLPATVVHEGGTA